MSHSKLKPADDGYSAICPICNVRYGQTVTGPRTLELTLCRKCLEKEFKRGRGKTELTKPRLILQKFMRDVTL